MSCRLLVNPVLHGLSVLGCIIAQVDLRETATGCYSYMKRRTVSKVQDTLSFDITCDVTKKRKPNFYYKSLVAVALPPPYSVNVEDLHLTPPLTGSESIELFRIHKAENLGHCIAQLTFLCCPWLGVWIVFFQVIIRLEQIYIVIV